MNYLKSWWNNRQKKEKQALTNAIRSEFEVTERNGVLFLTHDGVAFKQIPCEMAALEIAKMLNIARDTAQTYRDL